MPAGTRSPTVGFVRSWFVPVAAITAFPTITAAQLTAATELTNYELPDSKVALGQSDSINEKAIGDLANTDVPTFAKYDGCNLHLFRSIVAGTGAVGSDDLLSVF